MDLNYLYERHQLSLFMAENAVNKPMRRTHREFAKHYAERIAGLKTPSLSPAAA